MAASAAAAFACPAAGLPLLGWPAFSSGVVAVLIDLDRTGLPPGRTPVTHSPAAALLWTFTGWAAAAALAPAAAPGVALAVAAAFVTHLALDLLTEGGIFLWPRGRAPADWLLPFPPERLLVLDGRQFLVPDAAKGTLDGEGPLPAAWGGWGRWSPLGSRPGSLPGAGRLRSLLPLDDQDARLGIAVSGAGLATLLLALLVA